MGVNRRSICGPAEAGLIRATPYRGRIFRENAPLNASFMQDRGFLETSLETVQREKPDGFRQV